MMKAAATQAVLLIRILLLVILTLAVALDQAVRVAVLAAAQDLTVIVGVRLLGNDHVAALVVELLTDTHPMVDEDARGLTSVADTMTIDVVKVKGTLKYIQLRRGKEKTFVYENKTQERKIDKRCLNQSNL